MRIRSKLLALIAAPVLALSLAAAIGFAAQSRAIETAESSADSVRQSNAIYDAIVTVGAERLAMAGAEGDQTLVETREASDLAMTTLADVGLSTLAVDLTERLESARRTSGPAAFAIYADINMALFEVPGDTADRYPNAVSRDAAVINRLAVESLEMREKAWLSYLAAETADLQTATTLTGQFANAQMGVMHTRDFADSARMDDYLAGAAASRLDSLETIALDDLNEQELSVSDDEALEALVDFRSGWATIVDARTDELGQVIDDELRSTNDYRSLFTLMAVIGVIVGAGLIFVIYRSITTPLSSLLERASHVANEDLPNLVTTLRDAENDGELPSAEVIPVTSNDEIGELVSAFNDVQVTAYDLATEQALGRRAVGEMFVNLGRRNQQLLERILAKLTDLQQEEEDPATLASLFELDNVVTRMRRNAESLLVMAGATTPRQWSQSVDIENTVRAAFGEVEGYQRIEIAALAPAELRGNVVSDVAHLLAELLENSINFSNNESSVLVSGQLERETYVLNIFDQGIGMTTDELELNNTRITDPPPLDQVPTKFLGLYVVGRLADRHGINVRLGDAPGGGVMARIELPETMMVRAEEAPADAATLNAAFATPAIETADEASELDDRFDLDAELASLSEEEPHPAFSQDTSQVAGQEVTDLQRRFAETQDDNGSPETGIESPVGSEPVGEEKAVPEAPIPEPTQEQVVYENTAADQDDSLSQRESEDIPIEAPAALDAREEASVSETGSDSVTTDSVKPDSVTTDSPSAPASLADSPIPSLPRRSVGEPTPAAPNPPATGGLPTRTRGKTLETAAPPAGIERRGSANKDDAEPPTDNSPEGAGNFSSMMTALSSGISRGLQDSEQDDNERYDNDRNPQS